MPIVHLRPSKPDTSINFREAGQLSCRKGPGAAGQQLKPNERCFPILPRPLLLDRSNLPISKKRPCRARQRKLAWSFSSAKEFNTRLTPAMKGEAPT